MRTMPGSWVNERISVNAAQGFVTTMIRCLRRMAYKSIPAFPPTLVCLFFFPAVTYAAAITAASCSQRDVQKAINSAKSGDVVLIPGPCSATWSQGVTIASTQGITLEPTGGTVSISGATALTINQNRSVSSRITGLTFTTVGRSSEATILVSGNFSPPSATARIDHNTFSSTVAGTWIDTAGGAPVLIDHNSLSAGGSAEMIHNVAFGPDRATTIGWTTDVVPGSANMVFIEDNTFTCTDKTYICNVVQSYYGARTVVRYNTAYFSQVDQHGDQDGARWWDVYGNTFYSLGLNQCCYMALRGGSGVAWGNTVADTNKGGGGVGLHVEAPGCSGTYPASVYPVTDQVGRGINQTANPAYFWNNATGMRVLVGQGGAASHRTPTTLFPLCRQRY